MGSLSSPKVPVINFSIEDLKPGTSSWVSVRTEIQHAFEVYGCFEAVVGEIQIQEAILEAVEHLFDLPLETRRKHPVDNRIKEGSRIKSLLPLWENMGIMGVQDRERLQSFTDLMWPEGNSNFCESVYSYVTQVSKMEKMLKRMVLESLGLEGYYDSIAESTTYRIQVNKYRVPETNETNLGLGMHTDSSFLSILSQNDVHGLEIQAKDGLWINITPSPSSFIVFAGDELLAWSNGRLRSAPHKVLMNVDATRYSVALFSILKGTIQAPEEMVDENHPLLFKPFNILGYRQFLSTEEGENALNPFQVYCGV